MFCFFNYIKCLLFFGSFSIYLFCDISLVLMFKKIMIYFFFGLSFTYYVL